MNDVVLELQGIDKSFFDVKVLKGVNFKVKKGKVLSLIGENGAGKSTLMNIIGGIFPPTAGTMKMEDKPYSPKGPGDAMEAGIAFIHQELNLFPNLSIADNMFITNFPTTAKVPLIKKSVIKEKTKELLKSIELDISPDTLVEKLSPGERQLVEICKALSTDPKIIIFDEPTTSLTNRETERLFEIINNLREQGKAIIYISHILNDVMNISDEIVVLRDGQVTDSGAKEEFTIDRMISSMVGRDINQLYPERMSKPQEESALVVKGVSQSGIVKDINFELKKGEVLGIFGLMGSGRSELARIIYGLDPYEKGEIMINGNKIDKTSPMTSIKNGVAFVTEDRKNEGLLLETSIFENMSLAAMPSYTKPPFKFLKWNDMFNAVDKIAKTLRLKSGDIKKYAPKSLSGGNQQKVVIGKWLMAEPSILIVDEPTRGIDVGAKYEVYSVINELAAEGKGILMISSELEELMGTCDRILVMSQGEIVGEFKTSEFNNQSILRVAFRQGA
ncbi:sugar ABC transporter ATP-binding protein [Defluviitalea saccharophila]|uniref:Sugar ABC transporter ATP-binding protein n=1 Tax=Defluviitalea saccharophila TaxID=879970 RepID=A0ABZ2Y546_9FIRM